MTTLSAKKKDAPFLSRVFIIFYLKLRLKIQL
jgi:hypothetical protein